MSLFNDLLCHLFGHREKSDKRPYLVLAADGLPHGETMLCVTCERCGEHIMDLGLSGVPWSQSREGERPCTCHPDDDPPKPCPQKYALQNCRAAAKSSGGRSE